MTVSGMQQVGSGAGQTGSGAGQTGSGAGQIGAGAGQQETTGAAAVVQLGAADAQQCCFILCRSHPADAGLPLSNTVNAITRDH